MLINLDLWCKIDQSFLAFWHFLIEKSGIIVERSRASISIILVVVGVPSLNTGKGWRTKYTAFCFVYAHTCAFYMLVLLSRWNMGHIQKVGGLLEVLTKLCLYMPQAGIDPPAQSGVCYQTTALPPSHHDWITHELSSEQKNVSH